MSQAPIMLVGMVALSAMAPVPAAAANRVIEEIPFTQVLRATPTPVGGYHTASQGDTVFQITWKVAPSELRGSSNGIPVEIGPATVDPLEEAIMSRLASIADLQDGWTGKNSKAPAASVVTWLQAHRDLLAAAPHRVSIVPASSGALALQWEDTNRECTAELYADDRMLLFVDHLDSDDMDESTMTIDVDVLERFLATSELP
jgi:hypothetical protein